ncbi:MAG: alpha/beta fold hydrolase [Solirubrobacteraceae bacterium]
MDVHDVRMLEEIALPGLVATEHCFEVPLDHDDPEGRRISVFARELADPEGRDRPFLVFFQGGPGGEAPRPMVSPRSPGWLTRALQDFRVLMLDQRGTGRSAPIGTLEGLDPQQQAEYLTHFRADSIVRDAEFIRAELGSDPWSVLGQSFGGMCVTTYLSLAPEGLREALITGGLPPLRTPIDDVYQLTYRRVMDKQRRYAERYPSDPERLSKLRETLDRRELRFPAGDRLTWRRFRQTGLMLGMSGGAERLHYLLELPADSLAFLRDIEDPFDFTRNPIYVLLHEACWADGGQTRWSAHRTLPAEIESEDMLTGEHVYPWMFEDYAALAPLREAAELLAEHDWSHLYDPEALVHNEVPCAAAIYAEDMYVERSFSEETASQIRGLRPWITNEYEHNGLRVDGGRILGRLLDLARGRI